MPVPKKKTSRMKKGQRRSHDHLKAPTLTDCPNCHDKTLPHTVCPHCGFYKGRQVVQPKDV